jgi:hypothetical protein
VQRHKWADMISFGKTAPSMQRLLSPVQVVPGMVRRQLLRMVLLEAWGARTRLRVRHWARTWLHQVQQR